MWTRSELKTKAKADFKANYWLCVLAALILGLLTNTGASATNVNRVSGASAKQQITALTDELVGEGLTRDDAHAAIAIGFLVIAVICLIISLIVTLFNIFVGNALIVGGKRFFTQNAYSQDARFGDVGYVFSSGKWGNVSLIMFLRGLYISLWSLLLVIPGIIKSYEYRMVPYILAENPSTSSKEAFAISKRLMNGQKFNSFVLDLSFILWNLLTLVPFVGLLYVNPYVNQTEAELYIKLKEINNM